MMIEENWKLVNKKSSTFTKLIKENWKGSTNKKPPNFYKTNRKTLEKC